MNAPEPILDYLRNQIPAYPFDPRSTPNSTKPLSTS